MIDLFTGLPGEPEPSAMRVRETGLAVVHEGEWVVPAEGSEADLQPVGGGSVIEVPIEIEVRVALDDAERRAIARLALVDLLDALDAESEVG